jgi:predicted acetyltransferase
LKDKPLRMERVDRAADAVLRNLFEHYMHDMAEWFEFDTNEDGAYAYPTNKVWEQGCAVFLAYSARTPIGFALVDTAGTQIPGSAARDLKEFFVIRRHRRDGIGRTFARYVWDQYPGPWLVRVYRRNVPAMPFWRGVIAEYTHGQFHEAPHTKDGRDWSYFTFASGAKAVTADIEGVT